MTGDRRNAAGTTLDVLVVGGGVAGATCAARCSAAGLSVRLVDRGRRVGGRMATRTLRDPAPAVVADTGTAAFGVHGDDFAAAVDSWSAAGVLVPVAAQDFPRHRAPRVTAPRGARTVVEHLLDGVEVESGVELGPLGPDGRAAGRPSRAVVLAMPGPQAARLLPASPALAALADQPYDPALTLVARYPAATWDRFGARPVEVGEELCWLSDLGAGRGDGAPVLLARATAAFAARHLAAPQDAAGALAGAVRRALALRDEPVATHLQRWTFAQPAAGRDSTHHLGEELVGLCGDGWSPRGGVEGAWRSGRDLADGLVAALR